MSNIGYGRIIYVGYMGIHFDYNGTTYNLAAIDVDFPTDRVRVYGDPSVYFDNLKN